MTPDTETTDREAVQEFLTTGKPIPPEVAQRIQERADRVRERMSGPLDVSVQIIREMRGPLDEEQERWLTLAQRDMLKKGQLKVIDPDTGKVYVLVEEAEYCRLVR